MAQSRSAQRLLLDTCVLAELQKHSPRVRAASGDEPARAMTIAIRQDGEQFIGASATFDSLTHLSGHTQEIVYRTRMVAAGIMVGCGSRPEPDMVARTSVRYGMRRSVPRISAMPSTCTPVPFATAR